MASFFLPTFSLESQKRHMHFKRCLLVCQAVGVKSGESFGSCSAMVGGGAMNSLEERFAWKTVGLQGTRMLFFVEFLI